MINYEPFFQQLVLSLIGKDKKDSDLTEQELRAAVANAYVLAVNQVAKDSESYIVKVAVDLYRESRRYPLIMPKGFAFVEVKEVETNGYRFNAQADGAMLVLPCCPKRDVEKAWFIHCAVVPKVTSGLCEFDEDFVEQHFEAILWLIRYFLAMQDAMRWHSVGKADRLLIEYKKAIRKLKRINKPIRLSSESLTRDSTCIPAGTHCHWC